MLVHPSFPSVMAVPQYSQVMTISPNFGVMGAPQLGQLRDVTPLAARTGLVLLVSFGTFASAMCVPHFMQ
jgi:hypothetical protein